MKQLALLAFVLFTTLGATAQTVYQPGDVAIDFKLKDLDGKMVSMADYKEAKGFIVVFTCNHCPFSIKYQTRINDLAKKYKGEGYQLLAINPNDATQYPEDSYDNMKVRAKEQGFVFPYLLDDTQAIAKAYGATKTPHVFILQKSATGSLYVRYVGAIDDNTDDAAAVKVKYVEQAISELNAGKPVSTPSTKAIGCGIKWKKA